LDKTKLIFTAHLVQKTFPRHSVQLNKTYQTSENAFILNADKY